MTEKDELLQAKERELAEAQQQLRLSQQVTCAATSMCVFAYTCTQSDTYFMSIAHVSLLTAGD